MTETRMRTSLSESEAAIRQTNAGRNPFRSYDSADCLADPASSDVSREADWGGVGTGKPIGASEVTKKRRHLLGAVSMAYPGTQRRAADSQFFIMRRPAPELDGKYTVFGSVLKGQEVVGRIQKGDLLKRAYLKDEAARS